MEREETIDLKDLMFRILLKWRLALGGIVVFAIVGGLYGAFDSYRDRQAVEAQLRQTDTEPDYSQYEESLSETEIRQVRDASEEYLSYEVVYRQVKEYYGDSIKMHLDANEVAEKKLFYRIEGSDNAKEIIELIKENALTDEVCQAIIVENQWDVENPEYVRELISIAALSAENAMGAKFEYRNNAETAISSANVMLNDDDSEVMFVKVTAATRKECQNMMAQLRDSVASAADGLRDIYGQFQMQEISESDSTGADRGLLQEQQNFLEEMNAANNLMDAADDALSDAQKEYFLALVNDSGAEEAIGEETDAEQVQTELPPVQYIRIKMIALGGIIGLFIVCLYIACRYAMDGRLNAGVFALEETGEILLGTIYADHGKKKFAGAIDQFIIRLFRGRKMAFTKEERLQMAEAAVLAAVRKDSIRNLYISGTAASKEAKGLMAELEDRIGAKEVSVRKGASILHSPESLEQLTLSQGAVFVEETGVSYTQDVYEEIQVCKKNGIPIVGFVLIETL